MSTQLIEDARTRKKTARQLITELKGLVGKILRSSAETYIPAICVAFVVENPSWSNKTIRDTVVHELDFISEGWIRQCWPPWVIGESHRKQWETRHRQQEIEWTQKREILQKTVRQLEELDEKDEEDKDINEGEIDTIPLILETEGQPEDDRTVMDYFGDITQAQFNLWKALTRNDVMPHVHDDLIVEHIKPSRRFRKGILNKLESTERAGMSRRCGYLVAILQDTIEIIEEVDNK